MKLSLWSRSMCKQSKVAQTILEWFTKIKSKLDNNCLYDLFGNLIYIICFSILFWKFRTCIGLKYRFSRYLILFMLLMIIWKRFVIGSCEVCFYLILIIWFNKYFRFQYTSTYFLTILQNMIVFVIPLNLDLNIT